MLDAFYDNLPGEKLFHVLYRLEFAFFHPFGIFRHGQLVDAVLYVAVHERRQVLHVIADAVVGDTALRMGSMKDKSRVPLFGDCGTAIALEYDETASDIVVDFHTYGKGYEALMTPHGGFRHPATPASFEYEDFGNGIVRAPIHTLINGMNVFSFAISRPPKSVEAFLDDYKINRETDIDYFLIHQANKMIVDRIVKKLKLPKEKVPYNLEEFGNLGGASIPSLMVSRLRERLMQEETTLLMSSFGLGLSWGTMWMKTKPMIAVSYKHTQMPTSALVEISVVDL